MCFLYTSVSITRDRYFANSGTKMIKVSYKQCLLPVNRNYLLGSNDRLYMAITNTCTMYIINFHALEKNTKILL